MTMTETTTGTTTTETTTTGTTTGTTEPPEVSAGNRGWRSFGEGRRVARARVLVSSLRTRILAGYLALLALAVVASVAVGRQLLINDLNERIESRLAVVVTEIRGISARSRPVRGESAADRVRGIFTGYLRNNYPPRDGMLITLIDGRPFLRSRNSVPYRIDNDRGLMARWSRISESDRGKANTPGGPIEFLAVPLRARDRTQGIFVAVVFRDPAEAELQAAVRATGIVGLVVLLLGAILAWRLAGGVLRPVRTLTETTRSITDSDLSRRIQVRP